jgi:hypothetical protein
MNTIARETRYKSALLEELRWRGFLDAMLLREFYFNGIRIDNAPTLSLSKTPKFGQPAEGDLVGTASPLLRKCVTPILHIA